MTPNEMIHAHPESVSVFMGIVLVIGIAAAIMALWGEWRSK